MRKNKFLIFDTTILFLGTIFFYLPVIINKALLINRGNDLEEQFWPTYTFIKNHLLSDHIFPLWNNQILSGLPLLPDPQFSLFYPPNWFLIFLPLDYGFLIFFIFHTLLSGIGMYLLLKKTFNLSRLVSVIVATLYIFSPKSGEYLSAGHYGLLATTAWLPFVLLSIFNLVKKPNITWAILFGLSLSAIFYSHTVIFIITLAASVLLLLWLLTDNLHLSLKAVFIYILSFSFVFGFSAVTLLPQIEWIPETTRTVLLQERDVYPKWFSIKELFINIFIPWFNNYNNFWIIDTEKWITIGILPISLALIGFWKLPLKVKIGTIFLITFTLLISLNNASPISKLLLKVDGFVLMRVATRVWFVVILIALILCGFGLEYLKQRRVAKALLFFIVILLITESLALSWTRLFKPTADNSRFAKEEIYQYLKQDKDQFRVFCVNRCLSQKEAAKNNLELVEGYNTLLQLNYYKFAWEFTNEQWNYYTLAIPPIGLYKYDQIQPNSVALGSLNTKYIISPYLLTNPSFQLVKDGTYKIYKNQDLLPRAYYFENEKPGQKIPILLYQPNTIILDTSAHKSSQVVLSEIYSKGWKAYLNGKEEVMISQSPEILRQVNIKSDTSFVEFKYEPKSYLFGVIITITSVFSAAILFFFREKLHL